jgi:hypothetical protein
MQMLMPTSTRGFRRKPFHSTGPILRSEDALLLACASTGGGTGETETIRRLADQCEDWDYVRKAARNHRVMGLVTSSLSRAAADIVPCANLEGLQQTFRAVAMRNLFMTNELISLIRVFSEHGIDVIPLKGPLLAATAFGNVALREFGDLDVLVRRENFDQASELLAQLGYHQTAGSLNDGGASNVDDQLGRDFPRKDGKVDVELHWSFIQRWLGFNMDLEALWQAPASISVGGMKMLNLPAEILLLYLCAHGTKHRWARLCWVADVAQVLRTHAIDWDKLLKTAESTGSRRILFMGLHLARTLLGASVPDNVLTRMRSDTTAAAMARRICVDLFSSVPNEDLSSAGEANDWFYLRSKERWQDQFLYLGYWAGWLLQPSEKDRQWIRLSARFGWLYIFLRPIRVICTYLRPRSHSEFPKAKSL